MREEFTHLQNFRIGCYLYNFGIIIQFQLSSLLKSWVLPEIGKCEIEFNGFSVTSVHFKLTSLVFLMRIWNSFFYRLKICLSMIGLQLAAKCPFVAFMCLSTLAS